MNGEDRRIRTLAVVGDGVAGWTAAAALARRIPHLSVAVVPVAKLRPAMVDLFGGAAPSIADFHRDIGLAEQDVVVRTGSGFRLGTAFSGWTGHGSHYVHAFGEAGAPIGGAPFAQLWARASATRGGTGAGFDAYSPAAAMAAQGLFIPAEAGRDALLKGHGHGLQLDLTAYRAYLSSYAQHLGVALAAQPLAEVLTAEGRLTALRLTDGAMLTADLFVDATNGDARLIGALDSDAAHDWRAWLRCDSIVRAAGPARADPPALDGAIAIQAGWRLEMPLPTRTEQAVIYREADLGDRKVQRSLREAARAEPDAPFRFASGRRRQAWIGNVVAIGEAYATLEPLEAAPLHLLHAQVDRLVATLPDRDFAPVELDFYNRETAQEADRMRDFLILHYAVSRRPEPFWQAAAAMDLPAELAETLALFRERGRLPIRDGESFSRDSWLAVLLGQEVIPRRTDPVAALVDPAQAAQAMERFRQRLAASLAAVPPHHLFLAHLKSLRPQ